MTENNKDPFGILNDNPEVIGDTEYHIAEDPKDDIFGEERDLEDPYLGEDPEFEEEEETEIEGEFEEEFDDAEEDEEDEEDDDFEGGDDDDDDEDDEDDEEDEEDDDEEGITNPLLNFVEDWKEQGYIPEDLEVSEDITEAQLSDLLYQHKESTVDSALRNEVKEELIEEYGLEDLNALETAKSLHYGVQDQDLLRLDAYAQLAQAQVDELDDDFEEQFIAFGVNYYIDNGVPQDKAEKLAKIDLEDSDINAAEKVEEYSNHFRNRYVEFQNGLKQKEEYERQKILQQRKEEEDRIKSYLDKRVVGDKEYSEEQAEYIRDALFNKKYWVPDGNGGQIRVTKYEKKRMEYNQNPDLFMKGVFDFILSGEKGFDELEVAKEKGRRQVFSTLSKSARKSKVKKKRKTNKNKKRKSGDSDYGKEVASFEY